MIEQKTCTKCKSTFPIDDFYKIKDNNYHRSSYCKYCHVKRVKEWRDADPANNQKSIDNSRRYQLCLKKEVFKYYGNICACCGEKELVFLAIDHINGDGRKHRRKIEGSSLWSWLKNNDFPNGYRVLCHNCNWAVAFKRTCPHQVERI